MNGPPRVNDENENERELLELSFTYLDMYLGRYYVQEVALKPLWKYSSVFMFIVKKELGRL